MSSESWKAEPTISPYAVSASSTSRRGAAEAGAVAGRGGDQRAGLAGDHVEVVARAGPRPGRAATVSRIWPSTSRVNVSAWMRTASAPSCGGQLGGLREQEVAGEDRDVVVPAGVGGVGAAAQRGLVHHVVVVERADVGDLDDAGRGDRPRRQSGRSPASAASSTSSGRNRLPPAASRCWAASVTNGRAAAGVLEERLLDHRHPLAQPGGERVVVDGEGERTTPSRSSPDEVSRMGREVEHRARHDAQHEGRGDAQSAIVTVGEQRRPRVTARRLARSRLAEEHQHGSPGRRRTPR